MLNTILILAALLPITAFSSGNDVKPAKLFPGVHYVQVVPAGDFVSFVDCTYTDASTPCTTPRQIGKRAQYSIKELRSQRSSEYWQVLGALAGDAGVLVAGYFLGAGLAGGAEGADMAGAFGPFFIGAGGTIVVTAVLGTVVNALNPVTQYRQAAALQNDVIEDKEVISYNIDKFIRRLELVLNKLN